MTVGDLAPLVPTAVGVAESGRRYNSAAQGLVELVLLITLAAAPQLFVGILIIAIFWPAMRIMIQVFRELTRAFFGGSLLRITLFVVAIADIYWAGSQLLMLK